jgi:hypothetical protein
LATKLVSDSGRRTYIEDIKNRVLKKIFGTKRKDVTRRLEIIA